MDPISAAIVAGLAAGATKVAGGALVDGYAGVKSMLVKKFGGGSEVVNKVTDLESRPDSAGRQMSLQEEIVAAGADQDAELVEAANKFLELLKAQPGGAQIVLTVSGSGAAAASGGVAAGQGGTAIGGNVTGPLNRQEPPAR